MDVKVGPYIRLSAEESMLSKCGAVKALECPGQQGDQTSQP